jgi:hypothetical protein
MLISFNGSYRRFTYNCPRAFEYRAIKKIYPPKREDGEDGTQSAAAVEGILRHAQLADFIRAAKRGDVMGMDNTEFEIDSYPTILDLLPILSASGVESHVETEFYVDLDYNPLDTRPTEGHVVSAKPDFFYIEDGLLRLYDWKFGNPNWGASSYIEETEWFLAILASHYPDVGEFQSVIHFPNSSYTLPEKTYSRIDMANIQGKYKRFFEIITTRRLFFPIPATHRCRFCDYRSEDAGGVGNCDDTTV